MKRNLVNFTRGSQLLGHFSFMFAAGLKGPLIIAAIGISWTVPRQHQWHRFEVVI